VANHPDDLLPEPMPAEVMTVADTR